MVFPLVEDLVDQTIHDLRQGVASNLQESSSPMHQSQSSSDSVEKQLTQEGSSDEDSSQLPNSVPISEGLASPWIASRPTIGTSDASRGATSAVPSRQAWYGMRPIKASRRITTNPMKPIPRPTNGPPMSVQRNVFHSKTLETTGSTHTEYHSGMLEMTGAINTSSSQNVSSMDSQDNSLDFQLSYGPLQTQAPYRSQSTSQ